MTFNIYQFFGTTWNRFDHMTTAHPSAYFWSSICNRLCFFDFNAHVCAYLRLNHPRSPVPGDSTITTTPVLQNALRDDGVWIYLVVPPTHPQSKFIFWYPFRYQVLTRSASYKYGWTFTICRLQIPSLLLLPPKRYWDLTPTILSPTIPSIQTHRISLVSPYCLSLVFFFGSQTLEIIQVFISSDIGIEVESSFISESKISDQNSAQVFFVVLTSLMIPSPFGHE